MIRAAKICAGDRRRKNSKALMRFSRALVAMVSSRGVIVFRELVDLNAIAPART